MRDRSPEREMPRVSSGCRGDLTIPGGLPARNTCSQHILKSALLFHSPSAMPLPHLHPTFYPQHCASVAQQAEHVDRSNKSL